MTESIDDKLPSLYPIDKVTSLYKNAGIKNMAQDNELSYILTVFSAAKWGSVVFAGWGAIAQGNLLLAFLGVSAAAISETLQKTVYEEMYSAKYALLEQRLKENKPLPDKTI